MDSAQYERVKRLFESCRSLPQAERAIHLVSDGVGGSEVEHEVRGLLEAYDRSADFLEEPVLGQQAEIVERAIRTGGKRGAELAAGTRIAHYEIAAPIGSGGMGVVYRARDSRLGREVALKILPPAVADDPLRRARFQTEARALAALNHPNIAAIYGIEDGALVMELIPGPTLEQRLLAGPIPLEEAIEIARQIADGLEAAHERGIAHRDLKPANIKLTPDGAVKLLDFGLAKPTEAGSGDGSPNISPTFLPAMTVPGMILGTAGYMAPEQASGKAVDKRADVWAFGVVLFEMLSRKRLFDGETAMDSVAGVLRAEVDLGKLPSSTPSQIHSLLRRCLERNPKRRLRDIGEARILLEDLASGETSTQPAAAVPNHRRIWIWAAASSTVAALALGLFLWRATRPMQRPLIRLSVDLGQDAVKGLNLTAAISPDGTRLVYPVRNGDGPTLLATRLLEQSRPSVLPGSEGGMDPFFSPDGQWVGFFAYQNMKKVSVKGGAAVTICRADGSPRGAAWGEDDYIIANLDNSHLVRVPASGGKPVMLSAGPEEHGEHTWRWPQILPGGERILFTGGLGGGIGEGYEEANIEVLSLKTGKLTVLHHGGYFGRYLPSGHLTYVHRGTLFAIPLDLADLKTRGAPVPVLDDVAGAVGQAAGQLDFSGGSNTPGAFIYLSGKTEDGVRALASMDSAGKTQTLLTTTAAITPRISPDGKIVALSMGGNILLYDLERRVTTPLTSNGLLNNSPIWTPGGKHIIFSQQGGGESAIWWIRSDGSGEPQKLLGASDGLRASSLSPDGRRLAYSRQDAMTGWDIWVLPLDLTEPDRPRAGEPEVFLREPYNQDYAAFSPDGRWIAYSSEVAANNTELFVRPFPGDPSAHKWQISTHGGKFPVWSHTSKDLLYVALDNRVMRATYTASGAGLVAGKPLLWSPSPILSTGLYWNFDLAQDGKHIVAFPAPPIPEADRNGSVHVTLLLNFFDELQRRVP